MKKLLTLILSVMLSFNAAAQTLQTFPSFLNGRSDVGTVVGTEQLPCVSGSTTFRCTPTELRTFINATANPRAVSITLCSAVDTINTVGCDVLVSATPATALTQINTAIDTCGNPNTSSFTATISGTTLTVSSVQAGALTIGQDISGSGVSTSTNITSGSGTTWTVTPSQTVSSATAMLGYDPGSGKGCMVLLREGTYTVSGTIVIDRSHLTLTGETYPAWGGYLRQWTSTSLPAGNIAVMGSKIVASGTGYNLIQINHVRIPDVVESRHRGIRISNLYLVGNNYSAQGIAQDGSQQDDMSTVDNIMAQRFTIGVGLSFDAGVVDKVDVQDNSSWGIQMNNSFATTITNSIMWDNGGGCINFFGSGSFVANKCADSPGDLMQILTGPVNVSGNLFGAGGGGSLYIRCTGCNVVGNLFNEAFGSYSSKSRSVPLVHFDSGSAYNLVTGNTFIAAANPEPSGVYPISVATSGGHNYISNNSIGVHFNNNAATTIQLGSGTGDVVAFNAGDTSALSIYGNGKFTTSGCSISATTGSSTGGTFTLGANSCSAVVTMGGLIAANGWSCSARDRTTPAIAIGGESASTTTTATFTIPVTAGATDVIGFECQGY